MRVFISSSGTRSKMVAELLESWLQCVIQTIKPWMSSKENDRGSSWFSEIDNKLQETSIGIICLTQDNREKPWLLFQTGALAKWLGTNRVYTFLTDLDPKDIEDPLAEFSNILPTKDGLWNLVFTINSYMGTSALNDKVLEKVFETYWPQFEIDFKRILDEVPVLEKIEKRKSDDILNEILSLTRNLDKKVREIGPSKGTIKERLAMVEPYIQKPSRTIPYPLLATAIDERLSKQEPFDNIVDDLSKKYGISKASVLSAYNTYVNTQTSRKNNAMKFEAYNEKEEN